MRDLSTEKSNEGWDLESVSVSKENQDPINLAVGLAVGRLRLTFHAMAKYDYQDIISAVTVTGVGN